MGIVGYNFKTAIVFFNPFIKIKFDRLLWILIFKTFKVDIAAALFYIAASASGASGHWIIISGYIKRFDNANN